jgi:hypothetical protein
LIVETDAGARRRLDAVYVRDHVEHAYALTGHATQGASVEWAGVVGRPSDFAAEWAYTALSRARARTELHVIAEPSAARRERESYAPREPQPSLEEIIENTRRALRRRLAEPLAVDQLRESGTRRAGSSPNQQLPVAAERAEDGLAGQSFRDEVGCPAPRTPPPEPDWRKLQRQRRGLERGHHLQR